MTEHLSLTGGTIAYDVSGEGPLVVLAHGMGDTRRSYRFLVPGLVAAGYRVANVDIRGAGESSTGWDGYSRTDVAGDLVAVVRHVGGPAVIVGQSLSGGAAAIAAASAPDVVTGVVQLAPFTRKQTVPLGGLFRVARYRKALTLLTRVGLFGSLSAWVQYLDLAYPTKPADWAEELGRTKATLSDPERMKVLQAMGRSAPTDAGAQLPYIVCRVLVVMGGLDPDWADPRAEGEKVVADLPADLGELAVIDGAGHYPHAQTPDKVLELTLPFLNRTLARA
ncbi:alpha/beta hydrolase [Pseudonocardia petroleophila]|uniref:Alpha/beta hydrolase n=1 Tax=Pseudonocardia petroleophila TaxID=37331 RepID=A0A7G7MH15_9PSEU|nr:alpha/beta hydrolase [Pseudonocardia petroleophila]QNG52076.1 alpha/beta hydrolase [Pseudonocardia petroleophila]